MDQGGSLRANGSVHADPFGEQAFTFECDAGPIGGLMSKWQQQRAEMNRRELARLRKALPDVFPSNVLSRALARPFIPPTPRLAIDSYWRAHPLRADRLARALAARSGQPDGGNSATVKTECRRHSASRRHPIEKRPLRAEVDSAACADNLSINSAGISTYGVKAPTSAPPGIARASSHGSSGTRQANRRRCCDGFRHAAVAKPEVASGRTRR